LDVDAGTATATCAACGRVTVVWRRSGSGRGGRWQCQIARREQRHSPGEQRARYPARSRSRKVDHCEVCRVKPSPRAAVILRLRFGLTLCANCRTLLKADRALFIGSLPADVRMKYDAWMALRGS
jgi:hypothetical protein